MKKSIIFFIIFLFLTITAPLKAASSIDVQPGPVFRSGENITLTGQVDGDVYLVGGKVTVDAKINGDLFIIAGQAEVNGSVRDDLRLVAGQADIYPTVGDDLALVAIQANIYPSATISNTVSILSTQTKFSGQVDQQASILSNSLELTPEAKFNHDLKITYYQEPVISDQATVSGALETQHSDKLNYQVYLEKLSSNQRQTVSKITFLVVLQKLTTLTLEIFVGWILISLLPQITIKLSKASLKNPGSAIGWGLISLILTPLIGTLLILTLFGIPLGVLVFVIFAASTYLAKLIGALALGQQLTKKTSKLQSNFIIGVITLSILQVIPVLGWLAYSIIFLNGLGALSMLIYQEIPFKKHESSS